MRLMGWTARHSSIAIHHYKKTLQTVAAVSNALFTAQNLNISQTTYEWIPYDSHNEQLCLCNGEAAF
jgi:hypothetical protein